MTTTPPLSGGRNELPHQATDAMITVSQIRNGSTYMRSHLSANDYYSEKEKIVGQWHGKAAQKLGLEGAEVTEEAFESLRSNRHPETGEKLTPRRPKVALHDFVISAPKSASIAAMVGGDKRIVEAFDRCVLRAFERLESFAGVRVRAGKAYHTEASRRTGNAIAAVFRHDTSRLLDPQLHSHLVFANASWDEHSGRWLALQPKAMAEQSKKWIRAEFYKELAQECRNLGYGVEKDGEAFRLLGIDHRIDHTFSQRSVQREGFTERYQKLFGHEPGKRRVEQFIKDGRAAAVRHFKAEYQARFGVVPSQELIADNVQDWRSAKMVHTTRYEVHALQQSRMSSAQRRKISTTVGQALKSKQKGDCNSESCQPSRVNTVVKEKPLLKQAASEGGSRKLSGDSKRRRKKRLPKKHRSNQKLRPIKNARAITAALRGHPAKMMAWRLQQLARQRHGAQRRLR